MSAFKALTATLKFAAAAAAAAAECTANLTLLCARTHRNEAPRLSDESIWSPEFVECVPRGSTPLALSVVARPPRSFIRKCLIKDPDQRASAKEVPRFVPWRRHGLPDGHASIRGAVSRQGSPEDAVREGRRRLVCGARLTACLPVVQPLPVVPATLAPAQSGGMLQAVRQALTPRADKEKSKAGMV